MNIDLVPLNKTALLLLDYQPTILANIPNSQAILDKAAAVLAAARAKKVLVIHVSVGFRTGHPEINERNLMFGAIKKAGRLLLEDGGTKIHDAVVPQAGEPTIIKHRVNAFFGTPLDTLLRAREVETLVLLGISTSGVILSTTRYAADADYRIVVIKDCCADSDAEAHACLMEKILPRQASVTTSDELIRALAAGV